MLQYHNYAHLPSDNNINSNIIDSLSTSNNVTAFLEIDLSGVDDSSTIIEQSTSNLSTFDDLLATFSQSTSTSSPL